MPDILVVDDDHGMREFLEIMLTQDGYHVQCASNGKDALVLCKRHAFDLVITDLRMPKMDGISFLKNVKDISPETMVILITAYASGETALAAMKEGVYDYLEKKFDIEEFKQTVRDALEKKGVNKDAALFIQSIKDAVSFSGLIGTSKGMLEVYSTIKNVAATTATVLILGESGTGKELVAKAIHDHSPRKDMPFIPINCGGIPENLLESELFGYQKGAFTGASADKIGLFEAADRGTIFLDEIAELPPFLQVKLLRVLQEKNIRRIGSTHDKIVDVRIVAATNKDIRLNVKNKTFREDLYYRLNVVQIQIPPLRERREDISALTEHFVRKYSDMFGKQINRISSYALDLLVQYSFPGNVRELENIIERSIALGTSNIVLPENIVFSEDTAQCEAISYDPELPETGIDLNEMMANIERKIINKALDKAGGSKIKAAARLHITPDSLKYRLEKLGIR
ncbi:MAG: sigma-54 dependent transcriptional regulator [Pseudomonadota bacterium]